MVGYGHVTKWDPAELVFKESIAQRLSRELGYVGLELEERALAAAAKIGFKPWGEAESYNTLTTAGVTLWANLLIGAGGTTYTNAVAALGVGDSSAAFAVGQTNLQGAVNVTNRIRKAMNLTYPSTVAGAITFQSTFATTDANFTWNEWAIFNNVTDASGTMLNRAVNNLGTKTNAAAWQLTVTETIS